MRRRMAEQWNDFANLILTDPRIPDTQRIEMRRAFYAGGIAVFHAVAVDMSPGDSMTESDEQMLKDLAQEFIDYERDLKAGRA